MCGAFLSALGGGVSTRPCILPLKQTIAAEVYVQMLEADAVSRITGIVSKRPPATPNTPSWIVQEDGAPAHRSGKTRDF